MTNTPLMNKKLLINQVAALDTSALTLEDAALTSADTTLLRRQVKYGGVYIALQDEEDKKDVMYLFSLLIIYLLQISSIKRT